MRTPISLITYTTLRCLLSTSFCFPLASVLPLFNPVNGYTARRMTAQASASPESAAPVRVVESSTPRPSPVVHLYPFGTSPSHLEKYARTKVLHVVRHAEGTHNVKQAYEDIANLDARLTPKGLDQCRELDARIQRASSPEDPLYHLARSCDLVVTSPLSRCIQTTLASFRHIIGEQDKAARPRPPVLAHELIRETINHNCDRRRTLSEIAADFPEVDLSLVETEHDAMWESYVARLGDDQQYPFHRESAELHVVADRARSFLLWLRERPEQHVVCCSHAAFLRCLWNFGQPGDVPFKPPQQLDQRATREGEGSVIDYAVVKYCGSPDFENSMRSDFSNCELRSMIVAFPS